MFNGVVKIFIERQSRIFSCYTSSPTPFFFLKHILCILTASAIIKTCFKIIVHFGVKKIEQRRGHLPCTQPTQTPFPASYMVPQALPGESPETAGCGPKTDKKLYISY